MNTEEFYTLKAEIEELKKVFFSTSTNAPTTTQSDWITIYDMESQDESLNFSITTGITASLAIPDTFPDLTPYSQMRVKLRIYESLRYHTFDISEAGYLAHNMLSSNRTSTSLCVFSFLTGTNAQGKKVFISSNATNTAFSNGSSPKVTFLDGDTNCRIEKIEVK